MEHRWGNRVRSNLNVRLFAPRVSGSWGRLRDISLSGGFIETRLALSPLSALCLRLSPADRSAPAARVLHTLVVRRAEDGVGVEWFDDDADFIAKLVHELFAVLEHRIQPAQVVADAARHADPAPFRRRRGARDLSANGLYLCRDESPDSRYLIR